MMKNCLRGGAICLLALLAVGCKAPAVPSWTTSWLGTSPPEVTESKYPKPVRVAAVWSPAVLNTAGKKPTRGFGGRLYFYDAANEAVPVEGQLVVYGYNDTVPSTNGKTPDRKFAFTPEHFTEHYSPTELGASYSVWIPWDEVGGEQLEINLVPIFTATSGQLIVGQSSKNLLPGPTTVSKNGKIERMLLPQPQLNFATGGSAPSGVQQASYQDGATVNVGSSGLQETSIELSQGLAERINQAGSNAELLQQLAAKRAEEQLARMKRAADSLKPPTTLQGQPAMATPASGEVPPPWLPKDLPQARYARPSHPAPSSPAPPPAHGPLLSPPFHGAPPSYPPTSLGPAPQTEYRAAQSAAG
jgi:hypothetical protein